MNTTALAPYIVLKVLELFSIYISFDSCMPDFVRCYLIVRRTFVIHGPILMLFSGALCSSI